MTGRGRGRLRMRAAALVGVSAVLAGGCGKRSPSILKAQGSEAQSIASVWWLMFGLAAAVYVIVAGFIIIGALRGRGTEHGRPSRLSDEGLIWIGGIIVPTLILLVLAVVTVRSSTHLRETQKGALRVDVTGKQWWWQVRYPQQHIDTANDIHIPAGRPVEIALTSDNVIHSFWVPQLAGKVDTIPGQVNYLRFTARKPGVYRGQCAEYCGLQHANMAFEVIVDPAVDFDRWALRRSNPPGGPSNEVEARGQMAFLRLPCAGCHTIRGTSADGTLGPDLTDFGSRRFIGSLTVPNTKGNLAAWVTDAQSIKPGNLMPPVSIRSDELDALVAYLESLK